MAEKDLKSLRFQGSDDVYKIYDEVARNGLGSLEKRVEDIEGEGIATEAYVDEAIQTVEGHIPSIEGLATEEYVNNAVETVEGKIPSVEGLATEEYVDNAIEGIDGFVESNQGSENAGKVLGINAEGNVIPVTGGSGGTSDYTDLTNKPQIGGVTLSGNKTAGDLGLLSNNFGSENADKFLAVNTDGSLKYANAPDVATLTGRVETLEEQIDDTVQSGGLEDIDDAFEVVDENGNIALKITDNGELKTSAFSSQDAIQGYERFYPHCFTGYYNSNGTVVTSNANDYLYATIYVSDLQGKIIQINNDPNETWCCFKDKNGTIIKKWNTSIKSIVVPINAHSLHLSNYLYGSAIDFYITRPKRKIPTALGYINYVDFTRPNEIVWNDIDGGKVNGTMVEGTGLTLTNGAANRVIANKVCVLNSFTMGADIVLPEPTAVKEGGTTTYTYTGKIVLGTDVTGYGSNHGSCVAFDFANKTISAFGDGNGTNHTGTPVVTGNIVNAFEDGCRNFQVKIERRQGINYCTIVCSDSGKSDTIEVGYNSGTTYGQGGCMYDRPHIYSVSGSTVFKDFWVSAVYNPKVVICGDSITQGSRNSLENVWSYKFAEYVGGGSLSAGRGSGQIPSAMNSISTLLQELHPKAIVVAIGTNGTAVPSDVNRYLYMKRMCEHFGTILILCTPWACPNRSQCDIRAGYIRTLNGQYADFNRLTKDNFKDNGSQVTSYFTSDYVHLTASGNLLTYNYMVDKFGWLKNI